MIEKIKRPQFQYPRHNINTIMLDIKGSADYLSRSTGSFSNFSMLFAGNNKGSYAIQFDKYH